MKNHRYLSPENTEINITPLLDVFFVILIFFIATTNFTKQFGLLLPSNSGLKTNSITSDIIAIKINADDRTNINGHVTKMANISGILAHLRTLNTDITAQILAANQISTGTVVKTIDYPYANNIKILAIDGF